MAGMQEQEGADQDETGLPGSPIIGMAPSARPSAACPAASRPSRNERHALGAERAAPGRARRPRRRRSVTRKSAPTAASAMRRSASARSGAIAEMDRPRRLRP